MCKDLRNKMNPIIKKEGVYSSLKDSTNCFNSNKK
jgi:hypothetical protein